MDNNNKTEAQQRRVIADAYDALAGVYEPLSTASAMAHRRNGQLQRKKADELDPPQPEWQDGDLVRSRTGCLWEHSNGSWFRRRAVYTYEELNYLYGPLRKVYVSDPSENQVVVSVGGIDPDHVAEWLMWASCNPEEEVCIRIAEAVRDQLAGSEPSGDGA